MPCRGGFGFLGGHQGQGSKDGVLNEWQNRAVSEAESSALPRAGEMSLQ